MKNKITESFGDYEVTAVERNRGWEEAGSRKRVFIEVGRIQSSSGRGEYIIKRDEQGNLSCGCPAWVYRSGLNDDDERTCKHVKQFLTEGSTLPEEDLLKLDDVQERVREFLGKLDDKDFEVTIRKMRKVLS